MEKLFGGSWPVPFGDFSLKLDPLSLVFLIAIAILVLCAGVYGVGYLRPYQGKKPLGVHAFFYLILALVLVLIVTANNVILFLGAWEGMTLATYFLIIFHDEKASVRKAGFIYLIASHCATFFLFLMFFLMAHTAGSMDFSVMARTAFPPFLAGMIFLLSLMGFGVKAGFIPLHIWLPYAHPASPSHVSALMSGITIKMGIYGICRVLWIMKVLPDWCGYVLLMTGVISGLMGVLYALGQHELKKLLAYHSIENIGIIALGLGVGLLGRSHQIPLLAILGFGGGLLHVLNHSLFKGLLFLGAGSVIQKTHSGEMDHLGGLAKTLPVTSALFLVGALSICGLPLFNGFISEFIIYFGLFQGLFGLPVQGVIFCSLGILSLALMGALALACFCKVYGTVFLGKPRVSLKGAQLFPPKEAGAVSGEFAARGAACRETTSKWMLLPMMVLAGACVWIGLVPRSVTGLTFLGGAYLTHVDLSTVQLGQVLRPLTMVVRMAFLFLALVLGLVMVRRLLLGKAPTPVRETWSCGFARVSSRFQYTSASFARPIIELMRTVLFFRRHGGQVSGVFPGKTHSASSVHDASEEMVFVPGLAFLNNLSKKLGHSRIRYTQLYLMYILLFLVFLLIWKLK
jgi:hydrogenase-4 component B